MERIKLICLILSLSVLTFAQADIDTLSDNGIVLIPTQNEYPTRGVDIKCAIDTSGYMYMIGGCTYGNVAGGTHNSDIYRIDIKTGWFDQLYDNTTNPWKAGCQAGHAYDPTRNCIWFGNGSSSSRYSGIVPGLWKLQCPDGPVTKYSDTLLGTGDWFGALCPYFAYDKNHDLVIGAGASRLVLFYLQSRDTLQVTYPFSNICSYEIPSCMDTKRGLFAITLTTPGWNPTGAAIMKDIWFFNPADTSWEKKTPAAAPDIARAEMAYDSKNDKYIYFGSGADNDCETQIWAYDYDSNTWTQQPRNGRTYIDSDPESSTWPAQRSKHAFEYCSKYNVFASWGGLHYEPWITENDSCSDDDSQQPLWVYRYSNEGAAVETRTSAALEGEDLRLWPNPLGGNTTMNVECRLLNADCPIGQLNIYQINGKRIFSREIHHSSIYIPHSTFRSPGIYLLKVRAGNRILTGKVLFK